MTTITHKQEMSTPLGSLVAHTIMDEMEIFRLSRRHYEIIVAISGHKIFYFQGHALGNALL